MSIPLYIKLSNVLKKQILGGVYQDGDLLPSENSLAGNYHITRSTVRQALEELAREGLIIKKQGKGSMVSLERKSLGLLTIRGFSEVLGKTGLATRSQFIREPEKTGWETNFFYPLSSQERSAGCIRMTRLRWVEADPVMLEYMYMPDLGIPRFTTRPLVENSFFKTLQVNYQIQIRNVVQDVRAIGSSPEQAGLLGMNPGEPLLHIYRKLETNRKELNIYCILYCNTKKYYIGNIFEK